MVDRGRLPTFVVVGAMKCGTTSLYRYLRRHPEIGVSRKKETNYFIEEKTWSRGADWYTSNFDPNLPIRGDFSPNYSKHPVYPGVPERMKDLLPDAKLIYMVREPVDRMVSQYVHQVDAGRETRSFEGALAVLEDNDYVQFSSYFSQLERFLEHYPRENVMVTSLEGLSSRPEEVLRQVLRFLGADEAFQWRDSETTRRYNTSSEKVRPNRIGRLMNSNVRPLYRSIRKGRFGFLVGSRLKKPEVSPELRKRIQEHLSDDIAQLKAFAPEELKDWPSPWLPA
jgi:hypothetical protein